MTNKQAETDLYGTTFSIESMKVIAESIGIPGLPDEAAKELADDISFRLKHIIQDSAKFMNHAKRTKLLHSDVDSALKVKNLEVKNNFILVSIQFYNFCLNLATIWFSFLGISSISICVWRWS